MVPERCLSLNFLHPQALFLNIVWCSMHLSAAFLSQMLTENPITKASSKDDTQKLELFNEALGYNGITIEWTAESLNYKY